MKKIISIILCACLLFSFPIGASAQEDTSKDNIQSNQAQSVTPVIVVPGIGSSALYLNPNSENEASPINIDKSFIKLLRKTHLVKSTLSACFGRKIDTNAYIDSLAQIIKPFTSLGCDDNGQPRENIGINCFWEDSLANHTDYLDSRSTAEPAVCKGICDKIGAENVYLFNYDFRLDVVDYAVMLNDYIDNVKKEKNTDKVTLVSASLGTCVVSAYIDMYKDKNDIEKAVFLDGAFQGVSMTRLYQKDLYLDYAVVMAFISALGECYKGDAVDFASINKWINRFDSLAKNAVELIKELANEENIDRLYSEVVLPIVGNMPSLWECIPYENFDDCVKAMTDIGFLKADSGLYQKITRYHEIQGRLKNNLLELKDKECKIAIVCGYGFPGMPCTSEYTNTTDMLIDTCYSSVGALTAAYGEEIKISAIDEKYLSADNMIYSKACLLPEQTWFCKYVQHMEFVYGTDVNKFVSELATTDSELNIDSIEELTGYRQFTAVDNQYKLVNVDESNI
ncbi:MAG: hypothetical protein ACI4RR_02005 [Eubacterium sp.]